MHPSQLSINDYTYLLPEEKIAKHPLAARDHSKLLIFKNGSIEEDIYHNISSHLPDGSLLVFNNTRVIEARLLFRKSTGAVIELFGLEPDDRYADIETALDQRKHVFWKCLIGGASKWKHGQVLTKEVPIHDEKISLLASIKDRLEDSFLIEFSWEADVRFEEILHAAGSIPIPPYLKRDSEEADKVRYQTIYAEKHGSVAAPTAGLHFTPEVFDMLQEKQISTAFVTLHVGAGTFMPVKSEKMDGHHMHAEYIDISRAFIEQLINQDGNTFAVGTTSLRTLESMYWMGLKAFYDPGISIEALVIEQWEVYDLMERMIDCKNALSALLKWMQEHEMERLVIKTRILIAPGYKIQMVNGLITNFHQPQSTLLLLVAAITGGEWKKIYDYALNHDFRFLSYGDGCLLYVS
jgi:S-adenosylmethionine:tRNA ribosyltransferase-isomerase